MNRGLESEFESNRGYKTSSLPFRKKGSESMEEKVINLTLGPWEIGVKRMIS